MNVIPVRGHTASYHFASSCHSPPWRFRLGRICLALNQAHRHALIKHVTLMTRKFKKAVNMDHENKPC